MVSAENFSVKIVDFVVADVTITSPAQFPFVHLTLDSFILLVTGVRTNSAMSVRTYPLPSVIPV